MKTGWKGIKLKEVCQIKPPKKEAKEILSDGDMVSFVPMNDLGINEKYFSPTEERQLAEVISSYTYFSDGDVLLAKITPCFENGKLGIASGLRNGIGFGSSEFIVYRPKPYLSSEYLYYYLSQQSFRDVGASQMRGAVGHKRIQKEFYEDHEIPVPPLAEQERIARVLDKVFAAIDQAKANAQQNITNAKELFQSKLNQIFSQRLGSWECKTVSELIKEGVLCKPIDGNHGEIHPKKADFVSEGVPFVMASDLQGGEVNQNDCNFISRSQADRLRKGFAKDGDVLLSHKGTIGRVAKLITPLDYIMLTPQVTYYRIIDEHKLIADYLYFYMRSSLFQDPLMHIAGSGSTRAYIGITKQRELEVSYPVSIDDQRDIAYSLASLESDAIRLEELYGSELLRLEELAKAILHKAFSGCLE